MKDKDTPLPLVRRTNKIIPGVYDTIDSLSARNDPIAPGWPKFRDASLELNLSALLCATGFNPEMAVIMAGEATACYLWRNNQVVFSFDEDLSRMLAAQADNQKDTDVLPSDILAHPPYPCTYVKTNVFDNFCGFWYWTRPGRTPNVTELRFQFVAQGMEYSVGRKINLLHGKTIRECYDDTMAEREESAQYVPPGMIDDTPYWDEYTLQKQILHDLLVAMQFILYLASENADVQDVPQAKAPRPRKKRGQILDKASEVKEKAVGVRIGNAIRKIKSPSHSSQGGTGTKVRPHSRRGHWHHYWTGPRDGDRKLVLKWTAPTFIHIDEFRNDTVVIYPVKQEGRAS